MRRVLRILYDERMIADPNVHLDEVFHDEPPLFFANIQGASQVGTTDGHIPEMNYNRGVSPDYASACSKAIGEFLERYALSTYRRNTLIRASPRQLKRKGIPFLDPSALAGFSPEQRSGHPDRQFDDAAIFSWVKGTEYRSGRTALIPAQLVFWNYCHDGAGSEPLLREANSNGGAGYFSDEGAIRSGLAELIQRDAFLIYWLNRITPPRVDLESITDPGISWLRDIMRRYRLRPTVLRLETDLRAAVFITVLSDDTAKKPGVFLGGGCEASTPRAIEKSMIESLATYHWARKHEVLGGAAKNAQNPIESTPHAFDQLGRVLFWAGGEHFEDIRWLIEGPMIPLAEETPLAVAKDATIDTFLRQPRSKGLEMFVYRSPLPILRKIGYHAARVIVPALIPLYLNETYAVWGGERLASIPPMIGSTALDRYLELPHPFP